MVSIHKEVWLEGETLQALIWEGFDGLPLQSATTYSSLIYTIECKMISHFFGPTLPCFSGRNW